MKVKLKLSVNLGLEIQKKSKKRKNHKKREKASFLKRSMIWIALEILSFIIDKLVTWIINIFMNRPFYFYNRIFYLKERRIADV